MLSRMIALSFFALSLLGCAADNRQGKINSITENDKIVRGISSEPKSPEALATVSLTYPFRNSYESVCTGTLISEDIVITAAHCVEDYVDTDSFDKNLKVKLGTRLDSLDALNPEFQIEAIVTHPDYKEIYFPGKRLRYITTINDVALIKLKSKVPAPFQPATIIDKDLKIPNNTKILLAGWGKTSKTTPLNLKQTTVPLHGYWATHLILDQNKSGACYGDSGGPAFLQNGNKPPTLVGITRGPVIPYTLCDFFTESSNVSLQKDFIVESVKKLGGLQPSFVTPKNTTPHVFDRTEPTSYNPELSPLMPETGRI